ncbi:acyltransferase family protein [Alishewanella sp. HL-SH06]|uniref:acyltransferase family protein n=1 Tax=Alishewanella sp. HL-SH06 TaxID=3461144 RepID=UPI0040412B8D
MKYRKDIDGLRSVAVLPVLFFHAGFSGFSGGYVGVDIFFVISGFLITKILLNELENNKFSILKFYQRRARRILPALFSTLIFTTLFAGLIIPPELFKEFGQSLVSVGFFASNIFFYWETGYFGFDAEKVPLLHTWSLAVEEQFYIFVPPLLYLLYRFGVPILGIAILFLSISSLTWSQYLLNDHQQSSSFYLLFSRAWELFVGSFIAIYQIDKKKISTITSQVVSLIGLLLIVFSMFLFSKDTTFPGFSALIPVVGTFLIISFCRQDTLVFNLLSVKPMVWIGLISYSLYLIHQPLFALSRFLYLTEPSPQFFSILIVLCIIFSYLNYRFVETPFRNQQRFNDRIILISAGVGCLAIIILGLAIHISQGFAIRYNNKELQDSIQRSPVRAKCHATGTSYDIPENACKLNGHQKQSWAVLGDSHGVELSYALAERLKKHQIGLTQHTLSSCQPALKNILRMPGCSAWQAGVVNSLVADKSITTIVLIFRTSAFLAGPNIKYYPVLPDEDRSVEFEVDSAQFSKEQSYELYWENYQHLIAILLDSGKQLIIVDPLPELPLDIRQLIYPRELLTQTYHLPLEQTTPLSFYKKRNKFILAKLETLTNKSKVLRVSPLTTFCNNEYCSAIKNEKSLYFDTNHPSMFAAGLLSDHLLKEFEQNKDFYRSID